MARKKVYAAIDVGSHEIQMQIAEIDKDELPRTIEKLRRTLPIGTDTYMGGRISQAVLETCMNVLSGLTEEMSAYRIGDCRAVATSAFREAANRMYVLDQIERRSGLTIEVLSNDEERAYHIMAAAAHTPDFDSLIHQGTLVVDLGAGSIQVTVYDKGQFIFSQNMLLGSLRIRELLADLERRTADFASLMDEYISSDLDYYHLLEPKGILYRNLIVLGGEMPYLRKLAGRDPEQATVLEPHDFDQLYQQLLLSKPIDLALERDIPAEHASLLLPAALIISKFMRFTGVSQIHLPATTLCDAILLDFARKKGYQVAHDMASDILSACRNIAKRYHVDRHHTEFVERCALLLFDETWRLHRLPPRARLLLQAAVILHDCGKYINMSRHNIRSYNIILATEIIGLSQREKTVIAWTAGFHSGHITMEEQGLSALDPADQLTIAKLASLLRIANALDTGHQQKIKDLAVQIEEQNLVLTVTTGQDVVLEIWSLEKNGELFAEVFGFVPRIKIRRTQP